MADQTKIEWTDATWNPITGCTLVSDGCRNCYAAQLAATRLKGHPSRAGLARLNADGVAKFTGEVRFNPQWLDQPLGWKRSRMIFVCAHGDLFHESVPDEWIDQVFAVMALAPQHIFQVLTKRPERMRRYLAPYDQRRADALGQLVIQMGYRGPLESLRWPLPNVWLGTSVEDQATANERIPDLLATPAAVRWISAEPLLGPIDLTAIDVDGESVMDAVAGDTWEELKEIWRDSSDTWQDDFSDWYEIDFDQATGPAHPMLDWVVVGGESGKHARAMHPDWARSLRDQCGAAGVPFLFKQWGEWAPHVGAVDGWSIDDDPEQSRFAHLEYDLDTGAWGEPFWPMWCDWDNLDETQVVSRIGKRRAGRLLDGVEHNGFPEVRHG